MDAGFRAVIVLATALAGPATATGAEDNRPLSPAQIALFETDHLGAVRQPVRIEYSFRHEGSDGGDNYVDRVAVDVRPRSDDAKDIWTDFLSGERHAPFPPMIGFRGNPVLMFYLERDVAEMHRETGGPATYFRNRIRQAFVDRAEVRPVEVVQQARILVAREITLRPFVGEPRLAPFAGLADKLYRFILADAVPGMVYLISAEVPGASGQPPRKNETLTFAMERPCAGSEGPCASAGAP
jgi:hypothetical protein